MRVYTEANVSPRNIFFHLSLYALKDGIPD
jgi:hypothetical protein